ncbi:class I SAM-dependent methyltransferase [Gorillibacterium massiliense]|uniref:class I SAM-dependent methyltransferase n=1 Tax=Gorillibacterium massiliense TaxID=1280390 RepID=UPI0005925F31|nr:rRNA adenine N-6-methyltransferase family protein [Gorillibacterium massiliense]
MELFSFIKEYVTNPRAVGAVLPSSKYLAKKMIGQIDFKNASYIIEYGPGTGVITEQLLKNRREGTIIILFESNLRFFNLLKQKYQHEPEFHLINDSAENLEEYMISLNIPWLDYIVSGLPIASLHQQVSFNILTLTKRHLRQGGKFITFQYTLLKKDLIGKYFRKVEIQRELRNIPPAYIFSCNV